MTSQLCDAFPSLRAIGDRNSGTPFSSMRGGCYGSHFIVFGRGGEGAGLRMISNIRIHCNWRPEGAPTASSHHHPSPPGPDAGPAPHGPAETPGPPAPPPPRDAPEQNTTVLHVSGHCPLQTNDHRHTLRGAPLPCSIFLSLLDLASGLFLVAALIDFLLYIHLYTPILPLDYLGTVM